MFPDFQVYKMKQAFSFLVLLLISTTYLIGIVEGLYAEYIVGGYPVQEYDYTYQIYIRKRCLVKDIYCAVGGASIIDKKFALTSAHLFISQFGRFKNGSYEIVGGINNLTDEKAIIVGVNTIYMPINYNRHNNQNDIAVLKLDYNLELTIESRMSKLEMPISGEVLDEKEAVITGFGFNSIYFKDSSSVPRITEGETDYLLRYARVVMVNRMECQERNAVEIFDTVICACTITETLGQKWGPCVGDSGAPLVYNNKVIGVLSTVPINCVDTYFPSKYTKVWSYIEFIQNILLGLTLKNTRVYDNLSSADEPYPR